MAEEVIFELKVDKNDAFAELEKLKRSILQTKQDQLDLNKAFKSGQITQAEFAKEIVRTEALLKKQQHAYNNVQRSVTGVKSKLEELIESNKKLNKTLTDAISQTNVFGVNIGTLTAKLQSFANPATAAIGIASALGAAYARSTIGAKDLEFAHNQLAAATTLVTNAFANFISSTKDGEGAVSSFLNSVLFTLSPQLQAESKLLANLSEQAEDLARKEIETRGDISDRLTENQEKLTKIAEEQTTYNEKVQLGSEIVDNLKKNQEDLKGVLEEQLSVITTQLAFDQQNESLLTLKLQKEREINKLVADTTRKLESQVRANQNIIDAESKRIAFERKTARESGKSGQFSDIEGFSNQDKTGTDFLGATGTSPQIDSAKIISDGLKKIETDRTNFETAQAAERVRIEEQANIAKLQSATILAQGVAGLFQEGTALQKTFALIAIGIDTAEAIAGLTSASENNPANSVTFGGAGALQFAAGLARILANIATAHQYLSAAAGGGDFVTRGPALMMVGDNPGGVERVTVEPLSGKGQTRLSPYSNMYQFAGGGSLTAGNPGGLNSNLLTQDTNQSLIMANAMKNTKTQQVVAVRDIKRGISNVVVKDKLSRLKQP